MKDGIIKKIASFGERYKEELAKEFNKVDLERDWYGGLWLLLSHSFYQGRRDEVSNKVKDAAMPVLDQYFKGKDVSVLERFESDALSRDLGAVIGKGKIGKGRDVQMLVSIFKFLCRLSEKNLARYSVSEIERGHLRELYNDLMKIRQVGPKIASFYLRDLVDIYNLGNKIEGDDLKYLQPIDVWVRAVARKTGIAGDEKLSDEAAREDILRACDRLHIPAFRFNQGAWYIGKHAFDILLEHFDSI